MSEQLQWHQSELLGGGEQHVAFTQRGRYTILRLKRSKAGEQWATSRTDHPLMPPFDGYCPSLDAAKTACERDFIALARADRWMDYMRDNDPPGGVS